MRVKIRGADDFLDVGQPVDYAKLMTQVSFLSYHVEAGFPGWTAVNHWMAVAPTLFIFQSNSSSLRPLRLSACVLYAADKVVLVVA